MSVLLGSGPGSARRAPSGRLRPRRAEPLRPPTRGRASLVRGRVGPVGGIAACRASGTASQWPWLLALGLTVAALVVGLGLFADGVTAEAGPTPVSGESYRCEGNCGGDRGTP